jgi:hypothetical protein
MIFSKAEYISSINSLLPDNGNQEISPLDVRTSLINLMDSVPNFINGTRISTLNFNTPDTRTTLAGDQALNNMFLAGRNSVDNSAFGYASLRNNYNGSGNSAFGTYSLSCNFYGNSNSAFGLSALAGNTTGSGNVGLGSFALHNNKKGDFNIAIGHGAGWFIGPEIDYTFIVASTPIDTDGTCDDNGNPIYSGEAPLLYGNLDPSNHQLAIGTNSIHNFGMLQVSGGIAPTIGSQFNLGFDGYRWSSINEAVFFSGGAIGFGGQPSGAAQGVADGKMTVYGDLVPNIDERYALGHPQLKWDGYFNDVVISGQAFINDAQYNTISECLYECKTLHLATSGFCDPEDAGFHNSAVCGFLDDVSLDGAGLEVHSSGSDYRRDYIFAYRQPDPTLKCLPTDTPFSRSRFSSNISLEITSGNALITDRVLGREEAAMVTQSGCMGVFLEGYEPSGQRVVVAQEPHFLNQYPTLNDANFIARSGTDIIEGNPSGYDYTVLYGTVDSGVQVKQRFASRIKSTSTVRGFSIVYHDELDQE